jgi:hypothetical protein
MRRKIKRKRKSWGAMRRLFAAAGCRLDRPFDMLRICDSRP